MRRLILALATLLVVAGSTFRLGMASGAGAVRTRMEHALSASGAPPFPPMLVYGLAKINGQTAQPGVTIEGRCGEYTVITATLNSLSDSPPTNYVVHMPNDNDGTPEIDGCTDEQPVTFSLFGHPAKTLTGGTSTPATLQWKSAMAQYIDLTIDITGSLPTPLPAIGRGDCNADYRLDAADVTAEVLEIFDGDGPAAADAPRPTFPGHPVGCDANADRLINSADLTCIGRRIFDKIASCP